MTDVPPLSDLERRLISDEGKRIMERLNAVQMRPENSIHLLAQLAGVLAAVAGRGDALRDFGVGVLLGAFDKARDAMESPDIQARAHDALAKALRDYEAQQSRAGRA